MKTYIDLTRHGNAAKIVGVDDLYRPLTEIGIKQALQAQARYVGEAGQIKLVLHSPAPRALCTAAIIVGNGRPVFKVEQTLWVHRDESVLGNACWKALDEYGYDLAKYLRDTEAYSAMSVFGQRGAKAINLNLDEMMDSTSKRQGDIVLVAGHAICLNFVGFHLSGKADRRLLETELGEAERIRLIFEDGTYIGFGSR